jgi:hypothetical protein
MDVNACDQQVMTVFFPSYSKSFVSAPIRNQAFVHVARILDDPANDKSRMKHLG